MSEYAGRPLDIVRDLDWLIARHFATSNIYSWRGLYNYQLGRFEEAVKDSSSAYEMDSEHPEHLIQRARAYYQMQRYSEAIQDLSMALTSGETYPAFLAAIHEWRGRAYYALGKHDEALEDFNEIMRLGGGKPFTSAADYISTFSLTFGS